MTRLDEFIGAVKSEFPDDRMTWQKAVPTFHPQTADDAARFFKLANRLQQKIFITGFGNNIDPQGEPFINMVSVRTDRLNKFLKVLPEDFYVTVGAGYPLREINKHLAEDKLWMPHSALSYVGSVGGSIAGGLNTDLDGHDLPLKKYFIQAEIVTPEGEIITPGSACFKSVSGYDIVKIFSGSWGLLGLVVSATFRIMPETAAEEFSSMKLKPFDRKNFLEGLREDNPDADAHYSRKVKAKFDPNDILPIV